MVLQEVPIGGIVSFNRFQWLKTNEAGDLFCLDTAFITRYDEPEYSSPSRDRRNHGNNFFPHSNVFQELNADSVLEYQRLHPYDSTPIFSHTKGFLDGFSPSERAALQTVTHTVAVPPGSRREFGKTYQFESKVWLPSAGEFGIEGYEVEGDTSQALRRVWNYLRTYETILTRSGTKDAAHVYSMNAYGPAIEPCDLAQRIHPMIRPDHGLEVDFDPNNNIYIVCLKEKFEEDILKLLEM